MRIYQKNNFKSKIRISDLRRTIYGVVVGLFLPFLFTIPYVIYKNPTNYMGMGIWCVVAYFVYVCYNKSRYGYIKKK